MNREIKKILKYLNNKDFFKLYSRNSSVQIAENFSYFCKFELKKFSGINFNELMIGHHEFMDTYSCGSEFALVNATIKKILNQSPTIKEFFENRALPVFRKYQSLTKTMRKKYASSRVSERGLLNDYTAWAKINAAFIAFNFFIYLSDPVIDTLLRELLSHYLKSIGQEEKMQEYLLLISTSLKKPAVVQEHETLLLLASAKISSTDYTRALAYHTQKWQWFPCYNPCDDPYTVKHYKRELQHYTPASAREKLAAIKREQGQHRKKYKKFLQSIKNHQLKKLIRITNMVCYYRERRNDIRREGLRDIRFLYERIGQKLGLNVKEVCYMTNNEIKRSLRVHQLVVSKKQIRSRIEQYVIFAGLRHNILLDNSREIDVIIKAIRKKEQQQTEVKGQPAFGGRVKGKVHVVNHIGKLNTFKQRGILVASMTGPDYVPAMKKATAVVTDEGGITCHAAVVCREFSVPCIVGTKFATKVFKDGDSVEVDAERGIVKKISA